MNYETVKTDTHYLLIADEIIDEKTISENCWVYDRYTKNIGLLTDKNN